MKSKKLRRNGFDYVVDLDAKGEVIGGEVLSMKKALVLAASESTLSVGSIESDRAKTRLKTNL